MADCPTNRRSAKALLPLAAAALILTGCGSTHAAHRTAAPTTTSPAASPAAAPASTVQTTGSVTTRTGSFVKYPGGAIVRIAEITKLPRADCYGLAASRTCVAVKVRLKNTGRQPIMFSDSLGSIARIDLYYGPDRQDADENGGIEQTNYDFPHRCAPGGTVTAASTFDLPTSGLSVLAVKFDAVIDAGMFTPYTFTDVQALIR